MLVPDKRLLDSIRPQTLLHTHVRSQGALDTVYTPDRPSLPGYHILAYELLVFEVRHTKGWHRMVLGVYRPGTHLVDRGHVWNDRLLVVGKGYVAREPQLGCWEAHPFRSAHAFLGQSEVGQLVVEKQQAGEGRRTQAEDHMFDSH